MPEFYPEHTPHKFIAARSELGAPGLRDFLKGYFDAAEWLLDENTNRSRLRGWRRATLIEAANECKAFVRQNAKLLETYCELLGDRESYTAMERAGYDFYLSRNGHGSGFFARGNESVFCELQDKAAQYSETYYDTYLNLIG